MQPKANLLADPCRHFTSTYRLNLSDFNLLPGLRRAPLVLQLAVEELLHGELVAADPVRDRSRAQVNHGASPRRLAAVDALVLKARLLHAVGHSVVGDPVRLVEEPLELERVNLGDFFRFSPAK